MEPGNDESLRATLADLGQRLPKYAQLSAQLVAEGRMTSRQQGQLLGPLGLAAGPLARFTSFIPVLGQASRILSLVGAVRYTLTQMDPEVANARLAEVGLTREQVEADLRTAQGLARRAGETGSREAAQVMQSSARVAGRLAGKGLKAFRSWQSRTSNSGDPDEEDR